MIEFKLESTEPACDEEVLEVVANDQNNIAMRTSDGDDATGWWINLTREEARYFGRALIDIADHADKIAPLA